MTFDWFKLKDNLNYYFLILISFFIPLLKSAIVPLSALFVLSFFFKKKEKSNLNFTPLILAGFYILGIISLGYTNNINNTLFNLEIKFSLLFFPIIFIFGRINSTNYFSKILTSFVEGCLVATILNFSLAIFNYYLDHNINSFFYTSLSYFSHVSYYSMYLTFAISIIYYFLFFPTKSNYLGATYSILLITLFSVSILFSVSKSGIITLTFVHFFAISYWVIKHKKIKQGLFVLLLIFASLFFSYKMSSNIANRINGFFKSLNTNNSSAKSSSTQMRAIAWEQAIILTKEKPIIGYGIGDVTDKMVERYKIIKNKKLELKGLNTHNQYLQILVGSGLIGLIYFLLILYYPTKLLNKNTFILYSFFLLIIIINFMTESMLERQSGVIFFSFFMTIFFTQKSTKVTI